MRIIPFPILTIRTGHVCNGKQSDYCNRKKREGRVLGYYFFSPLPRCCYLSALWLNTLHPVKGEKRPLFKSEDPCLKHWGRRGTNSVRHVTKLFRWVVFDSVSFMHFLCVIGNRVESIFIFCMPRALVHAAEILNDVNEPKSCSSFDWNRIRAKSIFLLEGSIYNYDCSLP